MKEMTKEDILQMVEEEDVEFVRLQFVDIFGTVKNVAITTNRLEDVLDHGCTFDGSSIYGFVRVEESDMYLKPDLSTFAIVPWRPQQGRVARLICDIYNTDGTPFEGDARYALKRALKQAQDMGYQIQVGPECEFFLFPCDEEGNVSLKNKTEEKGGFFDVAPLDQGENVRRDIILNLEEMGMEVESSYHEQSPWQHELDFHYGEALSMADNILTLRQAVKTIARRHGLFGTFMPKPLESSAGSGMHLNFSISDENGKNLFYDEQDENGLSTLAYQFMAGVMEHAKGMALFTNPLVNSYKRLQNGIEAPRYIAWSTKNRSPLIRIPSKRTSTRVELRFPDAAMNVYLGLACCIMAGLDGIQKKLTPPPAVNKNLFLLTEQESEVAGIESMPQTLFSAIEEFTKDVDMQAAVGEHITETYVQAKREEFVQYNSQVSPWEIENYLHRY